MGFEHQNSVLLIILTIHTAQPLIFCFNSCWRLCLRIAEIPSNACIALYFLYTIARSHRDTGLIMYLCCILLWLADSPSSVFNSNWIMALLIALGCRWLWIIQSTRLWQQSSAWYCGSTPSAHRSLQTSPHNVHKICEALTLQYTSWVYAIVSLNKLVVYFIRTQT